MLKELIQVAEQRNFFSLVKHKAQIISFNLKRSGLCMKHNITNEWLRSIFYKSKGTIEILVNNEAEKSDFKPVNVLDIAEKNKQNHPTGLVEVFRNRCRREIESRNDWEKYFNPHDATELKFSVTVAHTEATQLFLQWQRYRKIWWSSISTSPGLFRLSDIKNNENGAEVQVLAHFPWGQQPVETMSIYEPDPPQKSDSSKLIKRATLVSTLTAECALLTLLADGYSNRTQEEYLRLHRNMAPYKMSFAVDSSDSDVTRTLSELAHHLNHRLSDSGISTWFPEDFSASLEQQLKDNYRLGVPYTAVLTADSLQSGVLHLLHSSNTLREHIHISDFDEYATKLLKSCFSG